MNKQMGNKVNRDDEIFEDDFKNRRGKLTYMGDLKDGKPNGQGKITSTNGDVYMGEFANGSINGQGKSTYKNGDVYEGESKDNKRYGRGKYTFINGDIYEGGFKNGDLHGRAKKIDGKKRLLEQGEYESDKLIRGITYLWEDNGICTKIDANGNIIQPNITHLEDKIKVLTEMMHEMQTKIG